MGNGMWYYGIWGAAWVLIPLAGIIAWATTKRGRQPDQDRVADALAQTAETNRLLGERIDQLDKRLASIEKTLNDIP